MTRKFERNWTAHTSAIHADLMEQLAKLAEENARLKGERDVLRDCLEELADSCQGHETSWVGRIADSALNEADAAATLAGKGK